MPRPDEHSAEGRNPKHDPDAPPPADRQQALSELFDAILAATSGIPGRSHPKLESLVKWSGTGKVDGKLPEDSVILRGEWKLARSTESGLMSLSVVRRPEDPSDLPPYLDVTNEPGPWWALLGPGWRGRLIGALGPKVAEAQDERSTKEIEKVVRRAEWLEQVRARVADQDRD